MKFIKVTKILGILLGIVLLPMAYISLITGIALAFAGFGEFTVMTYVFAGLGIATIICSLLAHKNVWVPRIALAISTMVLLASTIFLMAINLKSFGIIAIYLSVTVFGIIATILSFLADNKKNISTIE